MAKSSSRRSRPKKETVVIPTELSEPSARIEDFLILLYGPPKIGKSHFCSNFDDPLFLSTEPGLKFIKARKLKIRRWSTFTAAVEALEKEYAKNEELNCGCIIIDTVDNLARFCVRHVCAIRGIDHPSDQKWGKGWDAYYDEWHHWIVRISNLDIGVVFVGHSVEREITCRGMQITKTVPSLPTTAYRSINAIVDFTFFVGTKVFKSKKTGKRFEKRMIHTKMTENMEAGDRSGKLPATIPLDYDKFKDAFDKVVKFL